MHAPRWAAPLDSVHRLPDRLRFEGAWLPQALRDAGIEIYVANINMGLPLGRKPAGMRYVLQLHDLFQLTQQNNHGSRLKARIYRLTDYLSIAWSLKVADQIWTSVPADQGQAARCAAAGGKLQRRTGRHQSVASACALLAVRSIAMPSGSGSRRGAKASACR